MSGVELKGHHTPELIAGYINGSQIYLSADGNNKVHKSSIFEKKVNYTQGYDEAAVQDRALFGGLDKVVVGHNPHDFYLGMYNGVQFTDNRYTADAIANGTVNYLDGLIM